ncbi:hypothetical protein [Streptomyces sp. CB03911]|uniref:hypothetical protein n=1 Tax=Streptomyces sp. CB03911 TaxID=1804758 RepID=UPI00093FD591|nr:hypothetical protein [Streptomyces sp. CB03911]OKI14203.1 hypothetical protein A6A07_13710 [Streptomyces sp. CB03911]
MINLLTLARRSASSVTRAARSVIAPATLFASTTPAPADLPTVGLYEADEMPAVADIEAAARTFNDAADQARRADRGKRAARKILDRLPVGTYGGWTVDRTPSSRQTADLDAIRKLFKQHGLGPVPMKSSAPSLKVARVDAMAARTDLVAISSKAIAA